MGGPRGQARRLVGHGDERLRRHGAGAELKRQVAGPQGGDEARVHGPARVPRDAVLQGLAFGPGQ